MFNHQADHATEPWHLVGDQCVVHGDHRPPVRETVLHHIWPLGMGGPDELANKVKICPNGHANVHRAIRAIIANGRPEGTRKELALAHRGVDEWIAAGRPGRPE